MFEEFGTQLRTQPLHEFKIDEYSFLKSKGLLDQKEWVSVHEIPPHREGNEPIEFAHFSKDVMIATWLELPYMGACVISDNNGFQIRPTHWKTTKRS